MTAAILSYEVTKPFHDKNLAFIATVMPDNSPQITLLSGIS